MKNFHQPAKTIVAIMLGLAFSGAALAAADEKGNSGETAKPVPSMKGDMGKRTTPGASTNISDEKGATANPTGAASMKSGMGASNSPMMSGTSTYNSAMMTIKSDYKTANAKCKAMPRADRGSCMTDAKSARNSETMKAKEMRKTSMGSSAAMGTSGSMSGTPEKKKGTGSY